MQSTRSAVPADQEDRAFGARAVADFGPSSPRALGRAGRGSGRLGGSRRLPGRRRRAGRFRLFRPFAQDGAKLLEDIRSRLGDAALPERDHGLAHADLAGKLRLTEAGRGTAVTNPLRCAHQAADSSTWRCRLLSWPSPWRLSRRLRNRASLRSWLGSGSGSPHPSSPSSPLMTPMARSIWDPDGLTAPEETENDGRGHLGPERLVASKGAGDFPRLAPSGMF